MFNFLFGNKIDRLVKEQARLKVKKQKIEDRMHAKNSAIGTRLQILENKSLVLKQCADDEIAEINRRIKKNRQQIKLEKDYYNSIGKSEDVNILGKKEKKK